MSELLTTMDEIVLTRWKRIHFRNDAGADHYNISVTLIGSGFTSKKIQSSQLVLFSKSEALPPRSLRFSRQKIAGSLNLSNYTMKQLN